MTIIQFLGDWIVRSSILILAGTLLLWLLRAKNPSVRLAAWIALLAGSLAVPLLTSALPRIPLAVLRAPVRPSESARSAPAAAPSIAFTSSTFAQPVSAPLRGSVNPKPVDWMLRAAVLYALITIALLLRLATGLAASMRVLRRSRPTGIPSEGAGVRESDLIGSPVVIGILRPAVLLPPDWRGWSSAKLDAVLAHERSHIRRCDPAVRFLSAIHRALLWASPLSWFLDRSIVRTAEQISDDDAVAVTRDRISYAEILLEFVQRSSGEANLLAVPMARYDRPEQRIRRILNSTAIPGRVSRPALAAILALGAPLVYLAAAANPQAGRQATPSPAPIALAPAPVAAPASIEAAAPPLAPVPTPAPVQPPAVQSAIAPNPPPEAVPPVAFEVASVKPSDPAGGGMCCVTIHPGGRVEIHALPLKTLIVVAFGLSNFQISGGDAWVEKEKFDIEAKPSDAALPTIKSLRYTWFGIEDQQLRQMLQALLIDRFQLQFHRETKTGDVYLLEQSGKPLRLHSTELARGGADPAGYGNIGYVGAKWSIYAYSMPQLAKFAADSILRVPVLDRTGLGGSFDYMQPQPDLEPAYGSDQSVSFRGFLSELGLKLERDKAPVEYLVIDHAARPTPN